MECQAEEHPEAIYSTHKKKAKTFPLSKATLVLEHLQEFFF
jgi:hypothetical protein